jgi:hypothetical protein
VAASTQTIVELRVKLEQVRKHRDELVSALEADVAAWRNTAAALGDVLAKAQVENVELEAKLEQAHAEAAVMREVLEMAHEFVETRLCAAYTKYVGALAVYDKKGKTVQAHHLLDVVARARELQVAFANWLNRPLTSDMAEQNELSIALHVASTNLVGALAVYDDKGKKEQADGEAVAVQG